MFGFNERNSARSFDSMARAYDAITPRMTASSSLSAAGFDSLTGAGAGCGLADGGVSIGGAAGGCAAGGWGVAGAITCGAGDNDGTAVSRAAGSGGAGAAGD